ncbi:MAG: hypothetical protein M9942_06125 [Microthrixaceae bacterium]|nr:hypothetical protein [Microthrixaceae bacterium]
MTCRTPNPLGDAAISDLDTGVTIDAPASVAQGDTFQVEMTADPIDIPTTGGGFNISYLRDLKVRFDVPAGSTFVGATVSGGSNLGSGTPSVSSSGGQIVLTVPGQLAPGTTAVLPTVTATLQATGASGTQIQARMSGSGYSDPAITFTARVAVLFGIDANTSCYAPVNPVLATTDIA